MVRTSFYTVLHMKFWEDITTPNFFKGTYQLQSSMNEGGTTNIHKIRVLVNIEKSGAADSRMIELTATEGTVNHFKTIFYPTILCFILQYDSK